MGEQTGNSWQRLAAYEGHIRLGSGLVLFAYVLTHFLNHALGMISLSAMEIGREVFLFFWRNWAGTILLYGALLVHMGFVLTRLMRRRSLKMPLAEALQIGMGLMIPVVMAYHVVGTRLAHDLYGVNDLYAYVLMAIMIFQPEQGILQIFAMFMVWGHGCFGLYFWLRLKPWFNQWRAALTGLGIAMPMLALGGYISGAREATLLYAQDPVWTEITSREISYASGDQVVLLLSVIKYIEWGVPALLVVMMGLRLLIGQMQKRRSAACQITWPDGRRLPLRKGQTVLDVARSNAVPHASVCGGRGRCSTCRMRVLEGLEHIPPASEQELKVLARLVPKDADCPPSLRLACQCKPSGPVTIMPLLPPTATASTARKDQQWSAGQEKVITVLFADLRGFTAMSENRLPYDTVFMLNQYFDEMGRAIEGAGGYLDKFIGDGIMALFGLETDTKTGANQAIAAVKAMIDGLDKLNENLKSDLKEPLRIGVGLHTGPAIVGDMGYGSGRALTAIGDTVNTASRVESATKEYGAAALVSDDVWKAADQSPPDDAPISLKLRGKTEELCAWRL